jgi:2',3'-cyclic-nucleotide 2'-phosphodiesterase (5'-nucleotidase family)
MKRFTVSLLVPLAFGACAPSTNVPRATVEPESGRATRLRIIGLNDFHGALEPRPDASGLQRGGAAAVAGAIRRASSECAPPACQVLILDGGDEFQGTPASNLAFGRPVVDIFNRVGLAAAALGNHEFDWGQDTLRARMRQARYAILGANVRYADGSDVPWIRNDTLITRGGLRIGVIGVSTKETATSAKPTLVADLRFVDAAPIVDSLAARLRARGAGIVLVVAHAGAFCSANGTTNCNGEIVDLARKLTPQRVDAIVSGHTHSLVNSIVNGVVIVQARSRGQAIDVVDLPVGNLVGARAEVREVYTDSVPADTAIARIASVAVASVSSLVSHPVATIRDAMDRDSVPLGNLIADAFRAQGHGDFGVLNNGAVRADLRTGVATYGDLFEVQPFGNILYRLTTTGAGVRGYFEKLVSARRPRGYLSGAIVTYDTTRAPGARVTSICLPDGRTLDSAGTYSVVINDFMLAGGSGLAFEGATSRKEALNLTDLDAFIAHLRGSQQPVPAPSERRFIQGPWVQCQSTKQ